VHVPVPAATPATAAAPARVPRLADLPDSLRRDLPALSLGGSVFADQPAARIVIVNGQVFREGERPAPGLLVQQIGMRTVTFEFRGQRFEVPL
jgi:general secretion pathway protein B